MKRLWKLLGTLLILSGLLVTAGGPDQPVWAAEFAAPACRLAAVHGSYEFVAPATITVGAGTVVAIPDHLLYASPAAYASKGTLIFNGAGRIILNAQENFHGPLASPEVHYGAFAVKSDCTAIATFANGARIGMKMAGSGKLQTLVSTTPGFVILRPAQTMGQ